MSSAAEAGILAGAYVVRSRRDAPLVTASAMLLSSICPGFTCCALGLLALACAAPNTVAPPDDGFVPLFDGASLDGWVVENTTAGNFTVVDGALRVEGPEGWLRSERTYADFDLHVEFRFLTDDADSGVFVRVGEGEPFARGWPGNSYQVQTRDISTNTTTRPILLGDIYRHRLPDGPTDYDAETAFETFTGTGEWQTYDIRVVGDSLTVHLNGVPLTRAAELTNAEGYLGLQGETGIVEYRKIDIRERTAG